MRAQRGRCSRRRQCAINSIEVDEVNARFEYVDYFAETVPERVAVESDFSLDKFDQLHAQAIKQSGAAAPASESPSPIHAELPEPGEGAVNRPSDPRAGVGEVLVSFPFGSAEVVGQRGKFVEIVIRVHFVLESPLAGASFMHCSSNTPRGAHFYTHRRVCPQRPAGVMMGPLRGLPLRAGVAGLAVARVGRTGLGCGCRVSTLQLSPTHSICTSPAMRTTWLSAVGGWSRWCVALAEPVLAFWYRLPS